MPRNYQDRSPAAHQRRPQNQRGDEWVRLFLRTAQVAHVATSREGQPFINPTTFWFDEPNHQIIFHSNIAGRVRSNLEANPQVCLEASQLGKLLPANTALEFSLQYRSVMVFGSVRLIEDPEQARLALYGLIAKYFPDLKADRDYRAITDKELRATSVYALQIESWSGKENWDEAAVQLDEWPSLDEGKSKPRDPLGGEAF